MNQEFSGHKASAFALNLPLPFSFLPKPLSQSSFVALLVPVLFLSLLLSRAHCNTATKTLPNISFLLYDLRSALC